MDRPFNLHACSSWAFVEPLFTPRPFFWSRAISSRILLLISITVQAVLASSPRDRRYALASSLCMVEMFTMLSGWFGNVIGEGLGRILSQNGCE